MPNRTTAIITRIFALVGLVLAMAAIPFTSSQAAGGTGCLPSSLKRTLSEVERRFGPVQVISAHRPGATIEGSGKTSYHASCRAVDFKPTRNHAQVVAWLKANHHGGVGTYSGSHSHIHIDDGAYVRFHKGGGGNTYAKSTPTKKKGYASAGTSGKKSKG